jgi:hypothetical protein
MPRSGQGRPEHSHTRPWGTRDLPERGQEVGDVSGHLCTWPWTLRPSRSLRVTAALGVTVTWAGWCALEPGPSQRRSLSHGLYVQGRGIW